MVRNYGYHFSLSISQARCESHIHWGRPLMEQQATQPQKSRSSTAWFTTNLLLITVRNRPDYTIWGQHWRNGAIKGLIEEHSIECTRCLCYTQILMFGPPLIYCSPNLVLLGYHFLSLNFRHDKWHYCLARLVNGL